MKRVCAVLLVASGVSVSGQPASAQDLSRYRDYALDDNLATVLMASGARLTDTKSLHERPAKIQELEWRIPYARPGAELADPVREISFTFYNDLLYRIVVSYERDRTEGMTNSDVVASLSAMYGSPVSAPARIGPILGEALVDTLVVAHWDSPAASVTLVRGEYTGELQLILLSKAVSTRARAAILAATRLDIVEAPQRELELRKREGDAAAAASARARATNKAAFRP